MEKIWLTEMGPSEKSRWREWKEEEKEGARKKKKSGTRREKREEKVVLFQKEGSKGEWNPIFSTSHKEMKTCVVTREGAFILVFL